MRNRTTFYLASTDLARLNINDPNSNFMRFCVFALFIITTAIKTNSGGSDPQLLDLLTRQHNETMEKFEALIENIVNLTEIMQGTSEEISEMASEVSEIAAAVPEQTAAIEAAFTAQTLELGEFLLDVSFAIDAAIVVQTEYLTSVNPISGMATLGDINYHVDELEGDVGDIRGLLLEFREEIFVIEEMLRIVSDTSPNIVREIVTLQAIDNAISGHTMESAEQLYNISFISNSTLEFTVAIEAILYDIYEILNPTAQESK